MKVVDVYTGFMADDIAADRMARLKKAGLEKITFAWAGEAERGKKHYYRIQGPTFLIEYDNTQNNGNHIHSVWRDFTNDFGRDLLREHIAPPGPRDPAQKPRLSPRPGSKSHRGLYTAEPVPGGRERRYHSLIGSGASWGFTEGDRRAPGRFTNSVKPM